MSSYQHSAFALALASYILISGCGVKYSTGGVPTASSPRPAPTEQAPPAAPVPEPVAPAIRPDSPTVSTARSLPAAVALRDQAASATEASNYSRAIGLLERAIRVSPRDPATYQALAENHLALNQPAQALQIVRRALVLDPDAQQYEKLIELEQQCMALL